jgi:predicted peptidase
MDEQRTVLSACGALAAAAALALGAPLSAQPAPQSVRSAELAKWQARFERKAFRPRSGAILPYRLARPAGRAPRPLVLVLHGSGAMGSNNEDQLGPSAAAWAQLLDDPANAPIILVPQVSARSADYMMCAGSPCASRPGPSFESLLQLLDSFAKNPAADRKRIYVTGFSMGGSAALQLALARPGLIAAMTLFAPVPPPRKRISELKGLPLFVVHGDADKENPFTVMRAWVRRLNRAGGHATFSVREGMAHQVPDDMLVDPAWRRSLLRQR